MNIHIFCADKLTENKITAPMNICFNVLKIKHTSNIIGLHEVITLTDYYVHWFQNKKSINRTNVHHPWASTEEFIAPHTCI